MKTVFLFALAVLFYVNGVAQTDAEIANPKTTKAKEPNGKPTKEGENKNLSADFIIEKSVTATEVKNQAITNTCWSFSTISLLESQFLKNNSGEIDLSEMFTVRSTYLEKAKNYILRQGHTQFSEGGLGHDVIQTTAKYGAVPEAIYSGLKAGTSQHNHVKLIAALQVYLDSIIKIKPVPENWMKGYKNILDAELGAAPESFNYNGKVYTPKTFAEEFLKFNPGEYVNITSFTHHNFYEPFVLEVPDNFSNGMYYNLPLAEMLQLTKDALNKGYSVLWDADVSNDGFMQKLGSAVDFGNIPGGLKSKNDLITGEVKEGKATAERRQTLFENLTTQDDHLMHITGLAKSKAGNTFFVVKNSWGDVGPHHGYINVSEAYFGINTISLVVPKAALGKNLLEKLKIK